MNAFFKDWMTMPVEAISEKLIQDKPSMLKKLDLSEDYINRGFRTLKLILNTADLPHQNLFLNSIKNGKFLFSLPIKNTSFCKVKLLRSSMVLFLKVMLGEHQFRGRYIHF